MTWQLNNVFSIDSGESIPKQRPCFDGRHVWYATANGLVRVTYWGPYNDRSNVSNPRIEEYDFDVNENLDDKLQVDDKTLSLAPTSVSYANGYIIASNSTQYAVVNASTLEIVTTLAIPAASGFTSGSNLVAHEGYGYFVESAPTTQTGLDRQRLVKFNLLSGEVAGYDYVHHIKQTENREIAIFNNAVYVTGINDSSVHVHNLDCGYVTSIAVNRDVEALHVQDGLLYVVSSSKAQVSVTLSGVTTYMPASMVSRISADGTVTHISAIYGAGRYVGYHNGFVWSFNDAGKLQRTAISDGDTVMDGTIVSKTGEDWVLDGMFSKSTNTDETIPTLTTLHITPSISYEHFDGMSLVSKSVAPYMFFTSGSKIYALDLRYALKWATSYELTSYTSVATGYNAYTGGVS